MDWFNSYGGHSMNLNEKHTKDIPDEVVEAFVASHEGGASLEAIGQVMGLTSCRVGQILNKALAKCQRACKERDISPSDVPCRTTTWDRLESM